MQSASTSSSHPPVAAGAGGGPETAKDKDMHIFITRFTEGESPRQGDEAQWHLHVMKDRVCRLVCMEYEHNQ
jgi:hypothetical protein